jgi:hypothetical protein
MKKSLRLTVASAAVALMVGGLGVTAANATVTYPEGGIWDYGVHSGGTYGTYGQVHSNYYHPSRQHRSTACGIYGCQNSNWVGAGKWANKTQPAKSMGNAAYYNLV